MKPLRAWVFLDTTAQTRVFCTETNRSCLKLGRTFFIHQPGTRQTRRWACSTTWTRTAPLQLAEFIQPGLKRLWVCFSPPSHFMDSTFLRYLSLGMYISFSYVQPGTEHPFCSCTSAESAEYPF